MNHKMEKRRADRLAKIERISIPGNFSAVAPLVKVLHDPDEKIRAAATTALGNIGDISACSHILPLLHDSDPQVRWAAANALGFIGDKTIVPHLAEAIFDPVDDVSLVAIMSIQWLGAGYALPSLVKLLNTESRLVRQAAQTAILQLGVGAVTPLLTIIQGDDRALRRTASELLILLGNDAIPQLMAAQQSDDPEVRQITTQTLDRLNAISDPTDMREVVGVIENVEQQIALQTLIEMKKIEPIIDMLIGSEPPIQDECVEALAQIGEEVIPFLITALVDADEVKRKKIIIPLEALGDAVVTHLLTNLFEATLPIRLSSAWALGWISSPNAVLGLLRALRDELDVIRWASARALGIIADESAARGLIKALEDPNGAVRIEAARSLNQMGIFLPLLATFRSSKPEIKWAAGIGISEMHITKVPDFIKAWKPMEDIQLEVSQTLQEIVMLDLAPELPSDIIDEIEQVLNNSVAPPLSSAHTAS